MSSTPPKPPAAVGSGPSATGASAAQSVAAARAMAVPRQGVDASLQTPAELEAARARARAQLRAAGVPDVIKSGLDADVVGLDADRKARIVASVAVLSRFLQFAVDNAVTLAYADTLAAGGAAEEVTTAYVARGIRIALVQFGDVIRTLEATIMTDAPCSLDPEVISIWLEDVPEIAKLPVAPDALGPYMMQRIFGSFLSGSGSGSGSSDGSSDSGSDSGSDDAGTGGSSGSGGGGGSSPSSGGSHDSSVDTSQDGSDAGSGGDSDNSMSDMSEEEVRQFVTGVAQQLLADEARVPAYVPTSRVEHTFQALATSMQMRA